MSKIRIDETPPGFAPEHIRYDWVGCVIPLPTEKELAEDPPPKSRIGSDNVGGYRVLTSAAIEALKDKGKMDAVKFWSHLGLGGYLVFKKEVCTLIT